MPSIGQHMTRARTIAEVLRHPAIDAERGAFYLGASAPDVRVITRRDRVHTHFFDLERLEPQDSVGAMFEMYPELSDADALDPETRAFMAGYITHLVLDEVYIETMFRPFFGVQSPMADDLFGNVLDRALQYEMNRREMEDSETAPHLVDAIGLCTTSNGCTFIEDEFLDRWREVVLDFARAGASWERFPRMMNIHLKRAGFSEEEIERFTDDGPALAKQAYDYVGEDRVAGFIDHATVRAIDGVKGYLRITGEPTGAME